MARELGNDLELGTLVGSCGVQMLRRGERDKHLYICGGTGAGKSRFLERLIRQDIKNWKDSKCGLLLIDPHGSVYDNLVSWIAETNVDRPIIPIDLRRKDWVVAYNLLRARSGDPAVIVRNFIAAMAQAWGEGTTDRTPLFARWAYNTLRALYDKRYTLIEAHQLMNRSELRLRQAMTEGLTDEVAAQDWMYANDLSPKDFDLQVSSTLNRLGKFIHTDCFRSMLGQLDVSLDLRAALDEGHIILVSLSRANTLISDDDARAFGTLLLSDLWIAAQERGKKKPRKPFYVYLDEFQEFVTPTIAKGLPQARGFGLCLTLAQQFPRQLANSGEIGRQIFEEVMENASSKVVFRLQNPENLKPLAQTLFMGTFDPSEIKQKIEATRVIGYQEIARQDRTAGRGTSRGVSSGTSNAEGWADTGIEVLGHEEEELAGWNHYVAEVHAAGTSSSASRSESITSRTERAPVLGKEIASVEHRSLEEQLFLAMQRLFRQEDRHCAVRVVGHQAPVFLRTPAVSDGRASVKRQEHFLMRQFKRWKFFLPAATAQKNIEVRRQKLLDSIAAPAVIDEPLSAKGRIIKA